MSDQGEEKKLEDIQRAYDKALMQIKNLPGIQIMGSLNVRGQRCLFRCKTIRDDMELYETRIEKVRVTLDKEGKLRGCKLYLKEPGDFIYWPIEENKTRWVFVPGKSPNAGPEASAVLSDIRIG